MHELFYDAADQLVGVAQEFAGAARYHYDEVGNLLAVSRYATGQVSIMSIVPAHAPVGARVEISGTGFDANTVLFTGESGPVSAQVVSISTTRIVVEVPSSAVTGPVVVRSPDGSTTAETDEFVLVDAVQPPTVAELSTAMGGAGTTVTVSGSHFDPDPTRNVVAFGRTRAAVLSATPDALTVTVPEAASSGPVVVRTPGGIARSAVDFVVLPAEYAPADIVDAGRIEVDGAGVTVRVPAGKAGLLRFAGVPGDQLSLGYTGNTLPAKARLSLFDPYRGGFARDQYNAPRELNGDGCLVLPTLPTSGSYEILVHSAAAGEVTFTLSRQALGVLDPATDGTALAVDRPGKAVELSFIAGEHQRLCIGLTDWTFAQNARLSATVFEPHGAVIAAWTGIQRDSGFRFQTFSSGTYRLVIVAERGVTGSARVWLSEEVDGGEIGVGGASVALALGRPGQQARLRFAGIPSQHLGVGFTDVDLRSGATRYLPGLTLVSPDGSERNLFGAETCDIPVLTADGNHELVLFGGAATGSLSAWLSEDADAGAIAVGGEADVTISRPGQNAWLRFEGTAGQRLSVGLAAVTITGDVEVSVYRPDGRQVASSLRGGVDIPTLTVAGSYQVHISPRAAATGRLTAVLSEEIDAGTIVVDGPIVPITVIRIGQNARVRFDGTAGQRLSAGFTGATDGITAVGVTLIQPDGTQLGFTESARPDDDVAFRALPVGGGYELVVNPDQGATGGVSITLSTEVDGGQVTIGGAPAMIQINRPGQNGRVSFAGQAGATLRLLFSDLRLPSGRFSLTVLAPNGTAIVNNRLRFDTSPFDLPTLPAVGDYVIIVDPDRAATGSIAVAVAPRGAAAVAAASADPFILAATPLAEAITEPVVAVAVTAIPTSTKVPPPAWDSARGGPWQPDETSLAGVDWDTRRESISLAMSHADRPVQVETDSAVLAGLVLAIDGSPLADVTVRIRQSSARTVSDGGFLLEVPYPGHRVLRVDGRSASTLDRTYGVFDIGVDLPAGMVTQLPHPIYMPQLDTSTTVHISCPTTEPVVLRTPAIPGLEVHIPAGVVVRDGDGAVATELSVTPIPADRPPFPLPPSRIPIYFTIQPGGGYLFPDGAHIVYPNYTREPPGTRMHFWSYDPDVRGWHIYGLGTVTPDGAQVVPDPDTKVYRLTGAMTAVPGHNPPPKAPVPGGQRVGDPVDPATGLLVEETVDLLLDDVLPVELRRTYQQGDPDSRPFGVGMSFGYNMFPWSTGNIGTYNYLEADLVRPDGSRIHFRRITPGKKTFVDAVFLADPTPTEFYGAIMAWNGNGWDIRLRDGTVYVLGDEAPLQAIRDRFGNTITITRAPAPPDSDNKVRMRGPITQVTSPNGKWIKFAYDSANPPRIVAAEDNVGRMLQYTYTADGRLETVTDPEGGITRYGYDPEGQMNTIVDPRGNTIVSNEYDGEGRVGRQQFADGTFYSYAYTKDTGGNIVETQITDPRGVVQRLTFNTKGQVVADTQALGTTVEQTVRTERDAAGALPLAIVDALDRRTELEYDQRGQVVRVTALAGTADARTELFERDGPFGDVTAYTDPYGKVIRFRYDPRGALLAVTDPLGRTTSYASNDSGLITLVTDPAGGTTATGFELGDPVTITDPLGNVTQLTYDAVSRLVAVTNPLGCTAVAHFDRLDRLRSLVDPLGRATTFDYDANGNGTVVTDARGNRTVFDYDLVDRVASITDPLGRTESFGYDNSGNMVRHTNRRRIITEFDYDELGRRTVTRSGVSGLSVERSTTYIFDAGDRVVRTVDTAAGAADYSYDPIDRLTVSMTPQATVSYSYPTTSLGRRVTLPGEADLVYSYRDDGSLGRVARDGSPDELVSTDQDGAGRRSRVGRADSVSQTYAYDAGSHVTAITYRAADRTLGSLTYDYDKAGRPVRVGGTFARVTVPQPFGPASYDAANQLTQLAEATLTYDEDGNLTSDGATTYAWDVCGQLAGIGRAGSAASFVYDAPGQRIGKTVDGTSTNYAYDGLNPLQEISGSHAAILVADGVDEFLVREADTAILWYVTDVLGTPIALVDESGTIHAEYTYEPFGATQVTGDDGGNPYRYTGREDDGIGLYYYRARYYSPTLRRFISRDPTGFASGDTNLYAYVFNQPTVMTDPLGTRPRNPVFITIAGQRLAQMAHDYLSGLPKGRSWRRVTVAVTRVNAETYVTVNASARRKVREFLAEEAFKRGHTFVWPRRGAHAEHVLYNKLGHEHNLTMLNIGISRQLGMCNICAKFFANKPAEVIAYSR